MRRTAGVIALMLVAGACSSSHHSAAGDAAHATTIPATPTRAAPPATIERQAATSGLHYTLKLLTPTLPAGGVVRVQLQVENRTEHAVGIGACVLGDIAVFRPGHAPAPRTPPACPSKSFDLRSGLVFTYGATTTAPARAGTYTVGPTEVFAGAPTAPLFDPLDLRVTPAVARPALACTQADVDAHSPVGMPAPSAVASHEAFDLGGPVVTFDPPTDTSRVRINAILAWKLAKRSSIIPISPVATYTMQLGQYTMQRGFAPELVWLITAHHIPIAPGTEGLTGPVGPTDLSVPPCFFTNGGEVLSTTTYGETLGAYTGAAIS